MDKVLIGFIQDSAFDLFFTVVVYKWYISILIKDADIKNKSLEDK
jgi:hypothetical protein